MPTHRREPAPDWITLTSAEGNVIGDYYDRDGVTTVRRPDGSTESAASRPGSTNEWLARLMLATARKT